MPVPRDVSLFKALLFGGDIRVGLGTKSNQIRHLSHPKKKTYFNLPMRSLSVSKGLNANENAPPRTTKKQTSNLPNGNTQAILIRQSF